MTEKHPWEELDTDLPEPGSGDDQHEGYPELPDAAPHTELPDGDADHDEDMS